MTVQLESTLDPIPQTLDYETAVQMTSEFLDSLYPRIRQVAFARETNDQVAYGLRQLRKLFSPQAWKQISQQICIEHPVAAVIHSDPITHRAFTKPRGYAGDSMLLDGIYQIESEAIPRASLSALAQEIYQSVVNSPACTAVRNRLQLAAETIDEIANTITRPQILALAGGHLREAQRAEAVQQGRVGRFVTLDQDPDSVRLVQCEQGAWGVESIQAGVEEVIRGKLQLGTFDLIYTLGLYDYVPDRFATKLTHRLFSLLNPGGRLLVGNFLEEIRDVGYMESYMGWRLIYRTPAQLTALSATIPEEAIAQRRTFLEAEGNIVFLEITRKA